MYFRILILIASLACVLQAANPEFVVDCTNCPESCNNDCYATFVAGKPAELNYPGPSTAAATNDKRKASGCTQSSGTSACGENGISPYKGNGDSCDEYPYASVNEGGAGSILRCVPLADNSAEGSQLSGFYAKSPNDGNEFKLEGGKYVDAKMVRRDSNSNKTDDYVDFKPDPSLYVPLPKRREFLLDNGKAVVLLSGDMETDFNGTTVASVEEGGSLIVAELRGHGKSKWFRPV